MLQGVRLEDLKEERREDVWGKGVLLQGSWGRSTLMCLPQQRERGREERSLQEQEIVENK